VRVVGDAVETTLRLRQSGHVWLFPEALGVTVWVEWPVEVFSRDSMRFKMRLDAALHEVLDEDDEDDGVPMKVLEEPLQVGDTVVLQRIVPVAPAEDRVAAHAAVSTPGVDRVSRRLHLVPPRAPVPRLSRPALYVPPSAQEDDAPVDDDDDYSENDDAASVAPNEAEE
jgi:hypothetical protein